MTYWKEWGAYIGAVMESGTTFGGKNLNWNRVESDYLLPNNRKYGGGLGIIQITSSNIEMLIAIKQAGGDISACPSGQLKTDLTNNNASSRYKVGSNSPAGGIFTVGETQFLQSYLNTESARTVQSSYITAYFNGNQYVLDKIASNVSNDKVKAFITRVIIWAPAYAYTLASAPAPKTVAEAKNQLSSFGATATFMNQLESYVNAIPDISVLPPVNILNYSSTMTGTSPNSPTPPSAGGNPLTGGASGSGNPELSGGLFYESMGNLIKNNQNIKLQRLGNFYKFVGGNPSDGSATTNNQTNNASNITPPDTSSATAWNDFAYLDSLVGSTVGTGQCYELPNAWIMHYGYPKMTTANATGSNPWGETPGMAAKAIPWDYAFGQGGAYATIKADTGNITLGSLRSGDIVSMTETSNTYNDAWGHVFIVKDVSAGDISFYDQNYLTPTVKFHGSMKQAFASLPYFTGLIRPN